MIPMIFGTALKIGKKIAAGIKQKKSLINGVMAAKKVAAQSMYIGTNTPIAHLSNIPLLPDNSLPIVKNNNSAKSLTLMQILTVFLPPLIGLLLLVAIIKFVFHRR